MRPAVLGLASSPILAVRELAAHALVPLVTLEELPQFILVLVGKIHCSSNVVMVFCNRMLHVLSPKLVYIYPYYKQ